MKLILLQMKVRKMPYKEFIVKQSYEVYAPAGGGYDMQLKCFDTLGEAQEFCKYNAYYCKPYIVVRQEVLKRLDDEPDKPKFVYQLEKDFGYHLLDKILENYKAEK